eukprot:scaffold2615_cov199-Alexandrium_tamarense.AAC.5
MNETEEILFKWRAVIEKRGCRLINTVMMRDALSHTMSLHKVIKRKNSMDRIPQRADTAWVVGNQFGLCAIQQKKTQSTQCFHRREGTASHGVAEKKLRRGDDRRSRQPCEASVGVDGVKNLQKLFAANGDLEFGDAVKMRYNGYLNYTNERRYNTSGAPEFASVTIRIETLSHVASYLVPEL